MPIIALTANAFKEDIDAAFAAGMNGHLTKPIDEDKMMQELGRFFKSAPAFTQTVKEDNAVKEFSAQASLKGINLDEGLKRFGGNADLYIMLMKRFLEDNTFDSLVKTLESGDMKDAVIKAHSVKGIAANLSMTDLFETAKKLEAELKSGITADINTPVFIDVKNAYMQILETVNDLIKAPELIKK